jgi:GH24 family phage-related lysozyme (muramidase)
MSKTIADFEGIESKVYKDTKGLRTVGVGFNMDQKNAKTTFEKYIPKTEVSFDDVRQGKKSITEKQALNLFQGTLNEKIQTTKRIFPKYDKYPKAVKTALVNGVFRGEFKKSHQTVKDINNGKWDKVPNEYLDRNDYRNSKPGIDGGIKTRMDFNANIFREYAKELKNQKKNG